jgi:hypothetical protein
MIRAFAAVLASIALPALAAPCAGFTDVDDSSPFCANVAWIKNRGVTLGCAAGLYCPSDAVSRLSLAAFMNRLGDAVLPPNVLWVAPAGGTFQSIQAAIDHAASIATLTRPVLIKVAPGTYHEAIRLAHHVRVEGSGQSFTTIQPGSCSPAQPGAVVMTAYAHITGVTIRAQACDAAILFDGRGPVPVSFVDSLVRDVGIWGGATAGIWMMYAVVHGGLIEHANINVGPGDHVYGVLADVASSLLLSDVKISVAGGTGSTGVRMEGGDARLTRVTIAAGGPAHPNNKFGIDVNWATVEIHDSIVASSTAIRRAAPTSGPGYVPVFVTYSRIEGLITAPGAVCLYTYDAYTMAQMAC